MEKKKILVPHDFSKVAECAVAHALEIAKTIDAEVYFLHVVGKREELENAKAKLAAEIEKSSKQTPIRLHPIVRVGNIFEDISDVAAESDVEVIIMGTHGLRGLQFLTGSYALKVITRSKIPFIVVQEKPPQFGYTNLVVPLDLSGETKQKLQVVADMASFFNSKVHLITPRETDEYLSNQLNRNLGYAEKFLKERKVEHTTNLSIAKSHNFAKELLRFSIEKNADLITIMNMQENNLLGIFGNTYEQDIITNEAQIPVMVVNPLTATVPGSVLFS